MDITIICTDKTHKIFPFLEQWKEENSELHKISLINKSNDGINGDILFLISCHEIIRKNIRDKFKNTLVIHESDLPHGKGWSPIQWQILRGENLITITLFEASDKVDFGDIWDKRQVRFEGHELSDEINEKVFPLKLELMNYAINSVNKIKPHLQKDINEPHFPKRTPKDSEINIEKSLAEQFNLLRIADNERYPCFFNYKGYTYQIFLKKI
jgi:methionyl-tRNA formyltransferase